MPKYKIIRLQNFKGGLHLARGLTNSYDKSLETLHSDTIKSAIFVSALQLFSEIGEEGDDRAYEAGKAFLGKFKVSSAFPFVGEDYYFPTPELPNPYKFDKDTKLSEKDKKKVIFIHQDLFSEYIKDVNAFRFTADQLKSDKVLTTKKYKEIIKSETYQHVSIPRNYGTDSTPYYVDKMYFQENTGLFFLLEVTDKNDTETLPKLKAALKLLADSGIGTDRNSGNGQFDVAYDDLTFDEPTNATHDLSLSLYCPKKEEIEGKIIHQSYYELVKRGGYISSPESEDHLTIRKRSIHFFTAGSVFPKFDDGKERQGKVVNLRPDDVNGLKHPIWRDGQAIFIPIKYEDNDK
jgi:CRISPR-associated protein Csm4